MDTLQKRLNDKADQERRTAIYGAFDALLKALAASNAVYAQTELTLTCDDGSKHVLKAQICGLISRVRDAAIASEESKALCRDAAARDFINKVESLQAQVDELGSFVVNN